MNLATSLLQKARIEDWGALPYPEAWERQKELVERRQRDEVGDTIIFCEHNPPVITLGRSAQRGERPFLMPLPGTEVLEVERGGFATWHGPGQIVIYPIVRLGARVGVVSLIRALEEWVAAYLSQLGVPALSVEGKTGVWVRGGERKIASIGIAARHWVSYHGLALNLATGLEPWRSLSPCGFSPEVMTDVREQVGPTAPSYMQALAGLRAALRAQAGAVSEAVTSL